ncbi:nibrin [Trichonephila clavipes]|nr:nibrin [Trichonephila clavipes]
MPSLGGYHPYGLASILIGLESNRACVEYAWPTNCSPSTPFHLSTGTSEGIACAMITGLLMQRSWADATWDGLIP